MKEEVAKRILNKVKADYSEIACQFHQTRQSFWKDLNFFKKYIQSGDKVLDVGCGNGRLLNLIQNQKVKYVGLDASPQLIKLAQQAFPEYQFVVGDALDLPFDDNSFDKVFAIALLHQVPSKKLRAKAIQEIQRVLKKDGLCLLTVWNLWQKRYFKYVIKNFFKKIIFLSKLDFKDALIPWKKDGQGKVWRYYHAFTLREFINLARQSNLEIIEAGYTERDKLKPNLFLIAKKVQ
jgi:ubiquinone/menaquinone biosynthesis C-methylase UbiE